MFVGGLLITRENGSNSKSVILILFPTLAAGIFHRWDHDKNGVLSRKNMRRGTITTMKLINSPWWQSMYSCIFCAIH